MSEAEKAGLEPDVERLPAFDPHDPISQSAVAYNNMESLRSLAISAKRIADALTPDPSGEFEQNLHTQVGRLSVATQDIRDAEQ